MDIRKRKKTIIGWFLVNSFLNLSVKIETTQHKKGILIGEIKKYGKNKAS